MALPEYGGTPQYWPSSQTTGTRKGTRTRSGLTPEQEAAAYTTGFGGLNPSTFGMVDPNAMSQLEEAFNTQVLGRNKDKVNSLIAEYGGAAQGGGNQASLVAQTQAQAALPFANLRYQNAAGGARMQANRAQETAMARYAALTQPAQTETWDESTTSTPMQNFGQNPYADLTPKFGGFQKEQMPFRPGGEGGGGQVGEAKGAASQPQDWWSRTTPDWMKSYGMSGEVNKPIGQGYQAGMMSDEGIGSDRGWVSGYAGLNPQAEATAALPSEFGNYTEQPSAMGQAETDYARRWRERHQRGDVGF